MSRVWVTRVAAMVEPGLSAAVASRLTGRELSGERPVGVDQTHESVIVGGAVVVKWLHPPVPAPHPGAELLAYLAAHGYTDMPAFLGVEEHDDLVLAIVTEYVPDSLDGWDWFVDDVDAWLRGDGSLDDCVGWARRMGVMTADLHTVVGGLQRSSVGSRTYHVRALDLLHEAMRVVDGDEGRTLRALELPIQKSLEPLRTDHQLSAHRIHGDLHAGQFLRSGERLLLNDFDGNPLADDTERRLPQSPLRDLASLLQSIDHVGRIVVERRHPDREADVKRFIADGTDAALVAYEARHAVDRPVLRALRVAQELHEYHYAAAHLPRWMYVPHAAMPALLAAR
jgi:maltokinase